VEGQWLSEGETEKKVSRRRTSGNQDWIQMQKRFLAITLRTYVLQNHLSNWPMTQTPITREISTQLPF
jgi:hypothetical protein